MKRIIVLLSLMILVLTGCSNTQELITEPNKTIEKITDKFNYETGKCLVSTVNVEYSSLNRGDEVTIVGEDDDIYFININNLILGVDKDNIRTSKEEPFEEYEGYTRAGVGLYSDIYLEDRIKSFSLNDRVKVIDKFKNILIIDNDGSIAYMDEDSVSKSKISEYKPPVVTPNPVPSSGGGGGSSSGGGGGGNTPPAPSSGDGEDIQLAYHSNNNGIVLLADNDTYSGKVLIDNTITFITSLNRDDVVYILDEDEDNYFILIEGRVGKINKKYIRKDSEAAYESWTAYTEDGAHVYDNYNLDNSMKKFSINDNVKVIDEIDNVCVIELEDGQIGYMKKSKLSENKIKVYVAPKVEEPVAPSGGGGSSSGGGGGGGNTPTPPAPEWTDPVL